MLQSRLDLMTAYLKSQPTSYLTDASISPSETAGQLDHEVLRSISALAAELKLTSPTELFDLSIETEQARTDGKILELLASMTQHAGDLKVLGRRVQAAEPRRRREVYSSSSQMEGMISQDWT